MTQADLIKVKKGEAKVIIKTNTDDDLPTFSLDMAFSKENAYKILVYALELKIKEPKV